MLTVEDGKKILEKHGEDFDDEEIALILEFLYSKSYITILQKNSDE